MKSKSSMPGCQVVQYEWQPMPQEALFNWKSISLYAEERPSDTEFVIAPCCLNTRVRAYKLVVGLLQKSHDRSLLALSYSGTAATNRLKHFHFKRSIKL